MVDKKKLRVEYVVSDYLASNVAWLVYNCVRYRIVDSCGGFNSLCSFLTSDMVLMGQLVFPLVMMAEYYFSGYYNEVFRKSRLQELFVTLGSALINSLIVFFIAMLNDMMRNRELNYELYFLMFGLFFVIVYAGRFVISGRTVRKIRQGQWYSKTIVVGHGTAAAAFVDRLRQSHDVLGYKVVGCVRIPGEKDVEMNLACYELDTLDKVCRDESVNELIVAPTKRDSANVLWVIDRLFALNLPIKITPEQFGILSKAKLSDLYGDPLVDISSSTMSASQQNIKRLVDVVTSVVVLLALLPVFAIVAVAIKLDSKGSVFYSQERVGQHNKIFRIYKFRSMVTNAEHDNVPRLSSGNDSRITKVGHFLRKYRVDELPQFWNVLKGDMSLVGPRPERQYFVNQILKRVPAYSLVHQVRPGITSMGMVKFGYAENLDEMVRRLDYDLLYLENMSLLNDLKIMCYTVRIVFTGKGV